MAKHGRDLEKAEKELESAEKDVKSLKTVAGKLDEAGVFKTEGNPNKKAALAALTPEERLAHSASIQGDRKTLVADSFIPAIMAVIYLLMMVYFRSIGGYKPVAIEEGGGGQKKKK